MPIDPDIKPGTVLNNKQIREIFKCSPQGGMRRSKKTNTLILISDHTKPFYEDVWRGDIFHYTGMGQTGDQKLDFMQNKTLNESNRNNVEVHLFEVFVEQNYVYQGRVKLVADPYSNNQQDYQGNLRKVWIFPLIISDGSQPLVPFEVFNENQSRKEKVVKRRSTRELLENLKENPEPASRLTLSNQYVRDPIIVTLAKRRANGKCQLCNNEAPFITPSGEPFLETHHILWLSNGGQDSLNNTVALCPNCHKKMHVLDLDDDKEHLKRQALKLIS